MKSLIGFQFKIEPPSSRGLGHLPFTEETGIQIPLGVVVLKSKLFVRMTSPTIR